MCSIRSRQHELARAGRDVVPDRNKYKDKSGASWGVQKIVLKGSAENKAKALVKGKGANLPDPTLGNIPAPVTAQLVNSDTSVCWEAVYDTGDIIKNESDQFKAKATTP